MRETFASIQLWSYALLIVALTPAAAYLGSLWDWTPGVASLLLFAMPTCAAAATGNRTKAFATASLSAVGCLVEAVAMGNNVSGELSIELPVLAGCVLIGLSVVIVNIVNGLGKSVAELEEQTTRYMRDLYRREREDSSKVDEPTLPKPSAKPAQDGDESAESHDSVDYAMLLLTLQDIGRRVSINLNIQTLIPTIISTAKVSLKCGVCDIYFWNEEEKVLTNALPGRSRIQAHFKPNPKLGMTRWVLNQRQILTRSAFENDYTLQSILDEDPHAPDAIAPLCVGGELLGLLVIDDVEQNSPQFSRLLYILANIYAMGVKNAQLFNRIEDMARRDGLTGLLNHASFQQELQTLAVKAVEETSPLTIVMSDVDHFKSFNDTYGHQAGDYVLREVAKHLRVVLPDYAVFARYGGEEFIFALPHTDLASGREVAEDLRRHIDSCILDFEGQKLHVTASLGVAEFRHPNQTMQDLIRAADEAMYSAKENGRNRVACDSPHMMLTSVEGKGNQ